jgi:hypothetical protein
MQWIWQENQRYFLPCVDSFVVSAQQEKVFDNLVLNTTSTRLARLPTGVVVNRVWVFSCFFSSFPWRGSVGREARIADNKVTWLILPVVICLSQRLSHACVSINNFILWNCERLIISAIIYLMVPYYMDNCGNSRANTCVKSRLSRGGMYLLDKKPIPVLPGLLVNHSNYSNRMASRRR